MWIYSNFSVKEYTVYVEKETKEIERVCLLIQMQQMINRKYLNPNSTSYSALFTIYSVLFLKNPLNHHCNPPKKSSKSPL